MIDKLAYITLDEMKTGYRFNSQLDKYICNICSKEFEKGEIFKIEDRYFDAEKMTKIHIRKEHAEVLQLLMSYDKKFTGITENQKELLSMIHSGMTDSEIAKKMGVAAATIRHQRFTFREKAKQAKLYLAIYELAFQGMERNKSLPDNNEDIIDVHRGAKMVDERYITTKAEEEQILSSMFSSIEPLVLTTFPAREKKKIVVLKKIAEQFERDKQYSEKELNAILKEIYEDFATIRRYLIEYGFMERTKDCKYYWIKK
jgi:transcriptional regulator